MTLSPEDRKKLISMARQRARPGSGTGRDTLRERSMEYGSVDLKKYLGSVPFVVVGGLATRLYMPERMTLDSDALVRFEDMEEAEQALEQSGCEKTGPLTIGGSIWRLPSGDSLDLIASDEAWVEEAIGHAVTGPDGMPYADLPYLVLMKLGSGRMQDLADISRMLGGASEKALDATRTVVQQFRRQDSEDLESLISLGRLEYE